MIGLTGRLEKQQSRTMGPHVATGQDEMSTVMAHVMGGEYTGTL